MVIGLCARSMCFVRLLCCCFNSALHPSLIFTGRSTRKFFQGQRGKTPAGRYTVSLPIDGGRQDLRAPYLSSICSYVTWNGATMLVVCVSGGIDFVSYIEMENGVHRSCEIY